MTAKTAEPKTERWILVHCASPQGQVSHLRGGMLKVRWDRAVRALPMASAHDLVRMGSGFSYALSFEQTENRYAAKAADLHAISSLLTLADFQPLRGVRITDAKAIDARQIHPKSGLELDELMELLAEAPCDEEGAVDLDVKTQVIVLDAKTARTLRKLTEPTPAQG